MPRDADPDQHFEDRLEEQIRPLRPGPRRYVLCLGHHRRRRALSVHEFQNQHVGGSPSVKKLEYTLRAMTVVGRSNGRNKTLQFCAVLARRQYRKPEERPWVRSDLSAASFCSGSDPIFQLASSFSAAAPESAPQDLPLLC